MPNKQQVAKGFTISYYSLSFVLLNKRSIKINDFANISIKSQKIVLFCDIFHVRDLFSMSQSSHINKVRGGEIL